MNDQTWFLSLLTPTPLRFQLLDSPLIKTNEVLPESEQTRVRGLLQEIECELETIDTEITRPQNRLGRGRIRRRYEETSTRHCTIQALSCIMSQTLLNSTGHAQNTSDRRLRRLS